MVWNAIIVTSIPSFLKFYTIDHILLWSFVFIALLYVSYIMYTTLVYYTGAVPSEFYTLQKRPNYKIYQQQTNRFFPGPQKSVQNNDL